MARVAQTNNDPVPSRVIGALVLLPSKHLAFFGKGWGARGEGENFFFTWKKSFPLPPGTTDPYRKQREK